MTIDDIIRSCVDDYHRRLITQESDLRKREFHAGELAAYANKLCGTDVRHRVRPVLNELEAIGNIRSLGNDRWTTNGDNA